MIDVCSVHISLPFAIVTQSLTEFTDNHESRVFHGVHDGKVVVRLRVGRELVPVHAVYVRVSPNVASKVATKA